MELDEEENVVTRMGICLIPDSVVKTSAESFGQAAIAVDPRAN